MEKIIVKFSRPLLFRESINGKYYLAYGFVLGTNFGALPPKISIVNPVSISEHNHPKRV